MSRCLRVFVRGVYKLEKAERKKNNKKRKKKKKEFGGFTVRKEWENVECGIYGIVRFVGKMDGDVV